MQRFGFAFGETFVEKKQKQRKFLGRLAGFYVLGGGLVMLLVGRLVQLQLVQGSENLARSENNRVKVERISAPRGSIFDRNGQALVRNVPVYKKFEVQSSKFEIISREEAERLRGRGEEVVEGVGREYLYGEDLAHVLGYVGEISEEELAVAREGCVARGEGCDYALGDEVGKVGIEKEYEFWLRGISGGAVEERGVKGELIRSLGVREPVAGRDIHLTLDLGLTRKIREIIKGRKGAVVVSEVKTGEILALVSGPSFDANAFNRSLSAQADKTVEEILKSKDQPLFNRALAGLYPPGSVFKIVTAVAALEEGEISGRTEIEDTGEIKIGEFRYGNWYFDQYGRTEGFLNIVGALKRSNDIFFYKTGERVGAEKLAIWGEKFGLGKVVGLGLGDEAKGLMPSPEWKERIKGERWFLGNTYHLAIGQGDLQVTPLQIHQMASVIAEGGKLCKPRIVNKGPSVSGVSRKAQAPRDKSEVLECESLEIDEENLDLVKQGMIAACARGGTAFPFFDFSTKDASPSSELDSSERVACKTGTAQFGDPQDRTHAWLVVFGPADEPEIMVTVLLEAAGEGSYEAGPVAREIFDYWFHERG